MTAVLAGCSPGVRQDRTIAWTAEGQAVGLQHDEEGIFVADKDGGQLVKIFQPTPDVLVTSPPLWSPTDKRLIFTTAKDPNSQPAQPTPQIALEFNPDGDVFGQRPIVYTCWLREAPQADETVQPVPLFEARCDHPGYVAANLAVRWHPRGTSVLNLKQTDGDQHGLFEYDLATKTSRQVFPDTAEALLFDWTPDGSHLVCVAGNLRSKGQASGIWIGQPEGTTWWQVPHSTAIVEGHVASLIEQLRAALPVWTRDGARFAFAVRNAATAQGDADQCSLWHGALATQQVQRVAEGPESFRDLHWAPDGTRLGLVRGQDAGSLQMVGLDGNVVITRIKQPIRRFAGWNAAGDQLAYVVPELACPKASETWALLLTPDPMPRDRVYVAPGTANEAGHEVFSGMRVTFPKWSPKENKLSVWFTFSPTHRYLVSRLMGGGLPHGDPAAVFDVTTKQVNWMTVNAFEKAQVGHYHLLKRQFEEACRWYREAEATLKPPRQPADPVQEARALLARRDFTFFEYYCLVKLGRPEEARGKLEKFQVHFLRVLEAAREAQRVAGGQAAPVEIAMQGNRVLRAFYEAEAFLSLDAAKDARAFFQNELATAKTEEDRLSNGLALSQLLLLAKEHEAYADLATATLRPLLVKLVQATPAGNQVPFAVTIGANALTDPLLPMYAPDFVATLSADQVQRLIPRWVAFRDQAPDDTARLTADLFLEAAYRHLGKAKELRETTARIQANPARSHYLTKDVAALVEEARQAPEALDALRQLFSRR
jgi:Tol biopolymer transport system component